MNKSINKPLILTALSALLLGFALAWVFKPDALQTAPHVHSSADKGDNIWTCSMHPQVRQEEAGLCPICEMDLVPMESSKASNPLVLEMSERAIKMAQIETVAIGIGSTASNRLRLSGKIKVDERLSASQVAHVPGRIEKLYVTFTGEQIWKGQKLADIYSPELLTAQAELLQALQFADQNPELLQAARKKLEYWKISQEQIAAIETSKEVQGTFTLYADASGIVKERKVSLGDHVDPGDLLFELQSLQRLWLIFDAYEEDLAHIKKGDKITFTTPALPGQTFETRVSFIDPLINSETRVAAIRGEISNRKAQLKPEMFIKGILSTASDKKENLLIPKSAVLWTGKRSIVYVKVKESSVPSFEYREITLGDRVGKQYIVESGLEVGEEIVSQGSFSIDAAAQLNNQSSMMNQLLEKEEEGDTGTPDFRKDTSPTFVSQLSQLANTYLAVKDALTETDASQAQGAIAPFLTQLQSVDMGLLSGKSHDFWMAQVKALKSHGEQISKSTDVEKQRNQFSFLSEALIQSLQAFGYTGTLYIQHCPMAKENTGADWLSAQKEIVNPYFGDKMLTCGSVEGILSRE